MYFYIFENSKANREKKIQEKAKQIIAELGISGENVTPNPARSIDELIDIGLTKGFSTFVGIGSDIFANKIISSLLSNKKNCEEDKPVFGFVPTDFDKSQIGKIINVTNIENACKSLRFRTLKTISLGLAIPNKYFITPLTINSQFPFSVHLILPNLEAVGSATQIKITPDINISFSDNNLGNSGIQKLLNIFKGEKMTYSEKYSSRFTTDALKLVCEPSIPVNLENEIIAKTPIQIKRIDNHLQIIINRGTIAVE